MTDLEQAIAALRRVYPGTELVDLAGGQKAAIVVGLRPKSREWTPSPMRGLLLLAGWPVTRPVLLIETKIQRNGSTPQGFSQQMHLGEAWLGFSCNAPWDAQLPSLVAAVHGWMARFDGQP